MHLTTSTTTSLSLLLSLTVGVVVEANSGSVHGRVASLKHRSLVQDIRTSLKRSSPLSPIGGYLEKRSGDGKVKRCKLRPGQSLSESNNSNNNQTNNSASSSSASSRASSTSSSPPAQTPTADDDETDGLATSIWKLRQNHEGSSFFDKWDFWSYSDPTHGTVEYQTREASWDQGLVEINGAGNAIMRVDTTQRISGGRKSVRIHDQFIWNGALVILDAVHMPVGCGIWPAFWSNGPNWPYGGEIDILEGVHEDTVNQVSIHTGSGCRIDENTWQSTGTLSGGPNCASYESGNSGCGMRSTDSNSYGAPFNNVGGGVYAMKWDDSGIAVYFFTRSQVPRDITGGQPQPDSWPRPAAFYPAANCNPYQFFTDNFAIFTNTMCGDWAGSPGSWSNSGCQAKTGYSNCESYVRENGDKFHDAYWEVRSVKIYQK